ncbi:MAG TPA: pitrilysin family protein [Polyangiales bacterium]
MSDQQIEQPFGQLLRVFVEPSHALPLVHFQLLIPEGSLADPVGQEGLTRLAARMLRRGTRARDARNIDETIDSLGAELGIDTTPSFIRLSGSVIRRNLEPMLSLVAELVREPSFPEGELEQLKRESIATLLELTDNDQGLCASQFRRALFQGHPYARSTLGTRASILAIQHAAVVARYGELAKRARVAAFSGAITCEEAEAFSARYFGSPDARITERSRPPEPSAPRGRQLVIVDKPERSQTQIQLGSLGTHPRDPDHTALLVGNAVFGGTFTSRLMRAVRSERGWSYGASSRLAIDRVREAFSIWTFPAAADAVPCIELELKLLEEWLERGITAEELAFAKSYLMKSHAFSVDTADKRVEQALDVWLYDLPDDYFSGYTTRIEQVELAQINAALKRRLSAQDLVITVLATEAEIGAALRGLPGVENVRVVPFDVDAS